MKPPVFSYHDPSSVGEALGLLTQHDNAKVLAGGQSLMPMLNMRYVMPDHIIDLNKIESLSYIREDGDGLEIGAMTRQRDLEFSDVQPIGGARSRTAWRRKNEATGIFVSRSFERWRGAWPSHAAR